MKYIILITILLSLGMLLTASAQEPTGPAFISSTLATYKIMGTKTSTPFFGNLGKATFVVFWASWCLPCLSEVPQINHLQHTYGASGLNILAMNMDDQSEESLKAMVKRFDIIYPVALPSPELVRDFKVHAIPAAYLYAPDGHLVQSWLGPASAEEVEKYLAKILTKTTAATPATKP